MPISSKFPVAAALALALAATPIALASGGASATATPSHVKVGKTVQMLVKGMKPNERVKAVESAPFGQTRTLFPRAGSGGALLVKVRAQVKGKHTWKFTGRRSHRTATTAYFVK